MMVLIAASKRQIPIRCNGHITGDVTREVKSSLILKSHRIVWVLDYAWNAWVVWWYYSDRVKLRGIGEGHLNFIFVVTVEPTINLNLPDVLAFTQITGISLCCLVTEAYGCAQLAQGCYPTMRWSGNGVSMPLGKSWNCVCIISRTCKVLENEFCPGKSWTFKCKVLESPEIC